MSPENYPQVGAGLAFPPRWTLDGDTARAATSQGRPHLAEAMRLLLRTELGARVMRPTLGVGTDRYVFEPRTTDVCYRLAHDVRRALLLWEPRVIVDEVTAAPAGADDRIDVQITYRIDQHSRPDNLVLPFALGGGS